MSPHNQGEDPGGTKKRRYQDANIDEVADPDKYKIFTKTNYKRLFFENGNSEFTVYVESTEQEKLGNKNPVTLTNLIADNVRGVLGVHRINAYKMGVTFRKAADANNFIKMEDFLWKNKMKAFIPAYLTEKIGVLRFVPKDLSNEEIYKNIVCDAEVISIKRFMRKVEGKLVPLNTVAVTFASTSLPQYAYIRLFRYEVKPYIPPLLQCYKCLKFNHSAKVCRGEQNCSSCAGRHSYKECDVEEIVCINCSGNHLAISRDCPIKKQKLEEKKAKFRQLSYATAVIESTQGAIWDVPFPAVTICDLNIVSKKAARELADNLTLPANFTADFVFDTFRLVPLLFSTFTADADEKEDLQRLQTVLDFNNITVDQLFLRLSPASSCSNLVQRCMWKNAVYRCDDIFKQIFTLLSLCCTFNYFAVDANHRDPNAMPLMATPRRVASCGYQTALTVLLYTNPEDYYSATIASQGALVIIDNAYNIPDLDSPVRMVNPATELLIALSPERTYTTAGIRSFSPDQRQCYYSDEVKVGKFRQYSFHNCMAYQKVEWFKKACNCTPLSFPREESFRLCNFNDMDCLDTIFMEQERPNIIITNTTEDKRSQLRCFPECEHYDYPLEVALGNLADSVFLTGLPFFDDVNIKNRSLLNVFFNDLVSTRYRRDVYLNWQNILAAFGGLLSLMLGFTLISGFDLILFFTIRVVYDSCVNRTGKAPNKIYVNERNTKKRWMDNATINPINQKSLEKYKSDYFERRRRY